MKPMEDFNQRIAATEDLPIEARMTALLEVVRAYRPILILMHDTHDFILFDTLPTVSELTLAVVGAVRYALIPTEPEELSVRQINDVIDSLHNLAHLNQVEVLGIVPTKARLNTGLHKLYIEDLKTEFGELVWVDQTITLERENAALKHEVRYQNEWGQQPLVVQQDMVAIDRNTLKQVALMCLDASQTPRTAAPLFLYILSQADETGLAELEATAVSRDLLKLENRRSWGNLLGTIYGTLVNRAGHSLRLNVTAHRYMPPESNYPPLPAAQPTAPESRK